LQKRELNKLGRLLSQNPSDHNIRTKYFSSLKKFKKSVKLAKNNFHHNILQKLNDTNDNDQKQFWKILKEINNNPSPQVNNSIPAERWHKYFSSLLVKDVNLSDPHLKTLNETKSKLQQQRGQFDHYINFKEIENAVKKLSNGKACSEDIPSMKC
jgi:hypothetical protein